MMTPLVLLENFDTRGNKIFIKDESFNPTGSIKDRTTFGMLLGYKNDGTLVPGATIVEATSGNTGISLAYYQKEFDYKAIIVMPESASIERREMIARYGGELAIVKGGMKECKEEAQRIIDSKKNAFMFNQFSCKYNPQAHIKTAEEIDTQLENIDYIFAGFGTGGTISGIGKYFKAKYETKIIGIEPEQSPLVTKGIANAHKIQGIGANFVPDILNKDVIDEITTVNDIEAIEMAKDINNKKQFYCGISSGAALLGALNYIKENNITNKNIVVIFPDKGDRYSW